MPRYWKWLASLRSPSLLDGATKAVTAVDTSLADRSIASRKYDVLFHTEAEYELVERLALMALA